MISEIQKNLEIGDYDNKRKAIYCGNLRGKDLWVSLKGEPEEMNWNEAVAFPDKDKGEYLPSIDELTMLYLNKDAVNKSLKKHKGDKIEDLWYWSSSEYSNDYSWHLFMGSGYRFNYDKSNDGSVRCFQL